MNGQELDTYAARLARFTDKGLSLPDAERLAERLVRRDREGDDRRLCLECSHLRGYGRWHCGNWQAADVAREGLAPELVVMLQRCGACVASQAGKDPTGGRCSPFTVHPFPGEHTSSTSRRE